MEPGVFAALSGGKSLPVASLRLLVPPVQLMAASMLQVLNRRDVMSYCKVAEFVSVVTELVPELLLFKHRSQLSLGLRARYILELCQSEQIVDQDLILSHLEKLKPQQPDQEYMSDSGEEAALSFLELIQSLLKDPEERRDFFSEVFPAEYGPEFDSDLQTLFSEFLFRLTQLLPVPDLEQTLCWLGDESSVLDDCVHLVSEPTNLKLLLRHHKNLGHLEQHVPPTSMGECVLSSLASASSSRASRPPEELQGLGATHAVLFVDSVADEMIAVTDYAEVELGTSAEVEVVLQSPGCSGGAEGERLLLPPGQTVREEEEEEASQGATAAPDELRAQGPEDPSPGRASGPHDCPDCHKKFRFASSLTAHRVIHTGERPHRCDLCGRCFSFRQSLDRHRHTHRPERRYSCGVCGEAFPSPAARTQHRLTHAAAGFTCHLCGQRLSGEQALARHLQAHTAAPPEAPAREEAGDGAQLLDQELQSSQSPAAEASEASAAPQPDHQVASLVKVRTSGRKRRPTMKIQVINLQKRLSGKRGKNTPKEEPRESAGPELRPLALTSAEHSYGSSRVSSKDGDEDGSSAAFSCPKCSFRHSEAAQVQRHIDDSHSAEAGEQRPGEQRPREQRPGEQRPGEQRPGVRPAADEEGRFICPHCDKAFRFQSLLRAHQRVHTGEQPFLCPQCGQRFSFKQSLERHKQTHASGRGYACLICGQAFKSAAAQREHRGSHMQAGQYLCSECGRGFAWRSALVRHLKTHGGAGAGRSLSCPRCPQAFSCAERLSRHLQTHQDEQPHACSCGKSFGYRAALTAHQRTHLKERPHACALCGKAFLYRGGLRNHMKIHSADMPFMCSFCGKSFKRERNMKKHERFHTRENVFRCSQCDKSFVYKATLVRHELTHSGERPFLCSHCGKGFFSHAELLKHERFHTGHKPFQCQHCGKKFTQSCYLTIHLRYHSGARPYACSDCDKSFLSANRLKRHQRIHSGEKPYLCGECGKGFRQAYNLKMHQRTHKLT